MLNFVFLHKILFFSFFCVAKFLFVRTLYTFIRYNIIRTFSMKKKKLTIIQRYSRLRIFLCGILADILLFWFIDTVV